MVKINFDDFFENSSKSLKHIDFSLVYKEKFDFSKKMLLWRGNRAFFQKKCSVAAASVTEGPPFSNQLLFFRKCCKTNGLSNILRQRGHRTGAANLH